MVNSLFQLALKEVSLQFEHLIVVEHELFGQAFKEENSNFKNASFECGFMEEIKGTNNFDLVHRKSEVYFLLFCFFDRCTHFEVEYFYFCLLTSHLFWVLHVSQLILSLRFLNCTYLIFQNKSFTGCIGRHNSVCI